MEGVAIRKNYSNYLMHSLLSYQRPSISTRMRLQSCTRCYITINVSDAWASSVSTRKNSLCQIQK